MPALHEFGTVLPFVFVEVRTPGVRRARPVIVGIFDLHAVWYGLGGLGGIYV